MTSARHGDGVREMGAMSHMTRDESRRVMTPPDSTRPSGAGPRLRGWDLAFLLAGAIALRWMSAPTHNLAEDPLTLIEAARHLLETGTYHIPSIGPRDGALQYILPSWPAGFPLMLAGVFAIFGTSEHVARGLTIAVSSLVAPLTAMLAKLVTGSPAVAFGSGILVAIHPLAVGFAGQAFTNNISATLFLASIYLLMSCLARDHGDTGFVCVRTLTQGKRRLWRWVLAFVMFGLMLSVRDSDVVFAAAGSYLAYQARLFHWRKVKEEWAAWGRCVLIATAALLVGWIPGLYFNVINFGSLIVSTHYRTGIRLSTEYLLMGSDAFLGLPGIVVMGATILLYQFPFFGALPLLWKDRGAIGSVGMMGALVILPMLLVNGAFPPAGRGAGPRYTLPLIPFGAIVAMYALRMAWHERRWRHLIILASAVCGWQAVLTYPPSKLFEVWPRFVYLAYYSPVYVGHPYHNYPDHTNAMVRWVREHTPSGAVIVAPSRWQHFVFYGERKVVLLDALEEGDWKRIVSGAPVYVVEDIHIAARPEIIESLKARLGDTGIQLDAVGSVMVFSPERGDMAVRAYRAVWGVARGGGSQPTSAEGSGT